MTDSITNTDNILDSRQIQDRINELEADRYSFTDGADTEGGTEALALAWAEENEGDAAELKALLALRDEVEGNAGEEWRYGVTLVADSYFEDYARELAEDIGAIQRDAAWPCYCIDWERAARDLRQDYSAVDFDGTEYWVRQ